MNKETMNIHKALSELKILDDRISNAIQSATFVVANKHSNTKIGGQDIAEFCNSVKDNMKSIKTLINRRNAIKRAVTKSNATTKVNIGGTEYTVAEAIDMKTTAIRYLCLLRDALAAQFRAAKSTADRANGEKLEQRCDEYIKTMNQGVDMKNLSEEIKRMREDFITSQTVELVDPINAAAEIEALQTTIDSFMSEVDAALSTSNAITVIEVNYN